MFSFSRSSDHAASGSGRKPDPPTIWTARSYAFAAVLAAGFAYFLLGVPVQLTDSFGNMQQLHQGTLGELLASQIYQRGYLRPLLWGQLRIVYDLSGGDYYHWFRGWHVGQVVLLFVLFLRLVRPRTPADFAAIAVGLAALIGGHTFAGTVREAFPINTFMTILLCCFAAADLALGEPRWWRDALAWLLFAFAAMTVESGLLVAVVIVAAFASGGRGVSRAGVAGVLLLLGGYFWLRFVYLEVGAPDLMERTSGFGFGSLEPEELTARFGSNPYPFYAYNILSSLGSVLLAEPRGGIFALTRGVAIGDPRVFDVVNLCASLLGTVLIARFAWVRRQAWQALQFAHRDRLVVIFLFLLGANAVISYPYTKDVIMSPAGAFFALAFAAAVAQMLDDPPAAGTLRAAAVSVVLLVTSSLWAWRMIGIHVGLHNSGLTMRNEWAYADQWFEREQSTLTDPVDVALKERLQRDAVDLARPILAGEWTRWFER